MSEQVHAMERVEARNEIKKHSATIQMSNRITAQQRRSYNALICIARRQLKEQANRQLFTVNIHTIKDLAGIEGTNNKNLKDGLLELMKTVVEFNVLKKDDVSWQAATLLAEARIEGGQLTFGFGPSIHAKLMNPDMYATLDLTVMRGMKSKYSIALYELAKDYINASIPTIALPEFRALMGLDPQQYTNGKDLRRYVVETAVTEVNLKSDLTISYRLITQGKKITGIKFTAEQKKELPPALRRGRAEELLDLLPEASRDYKGVRGAIVDFLEKEGEAYVRSNIAFAVQTARNNPQLLLMALKEDFAKGQREAEAGPVDGLGGGREDEQVRRFLDSLAVEELQRLKAQTRQELGEQSLLNPLLSEESLLFRERLLAVVRREYPEAGLAA